MVLANVEHDCTHARILMETWTEPDFRLTSSEEAAHPQEAQEDSHDARFVQMVGNSPGQWQSAGKLIKHLGLLTASAPGCVTGTQLPLLGTGPAPVEGEGKSQRARRRRRRRRRKRVTVLETDTHAYLLALDRFTGFSTTVWGKHYWHIF